MLNKHLAKAVFDSGQLRQGPDNISGNQVKTPAFFGQGNNLLVEWHRKVNIKRLSRCLAPATTLSTRLKIKGRYREGEAPGMAYLKIAILLNDHRYALPENTDSLRLGGNQ